MRLTFPFSTQLRTKSALAPARYFSPMNWASGWLVQPSHSSGSQGTAPSVFLELREVPKPCVPICSFFDLFRLSGLGEGQLPGACVSLVKENILEPERRYKGALQSTDIVLGVQDSHDCSPHFPAPRILPTRVFLQLDPHLRGFFFLASEQHPPALCGTDTPFGVVLYCLSSDWV